MSRACSRSRATSLSIFGLLGALACGGDTSEGPPELMEPLEPSEPSSSDGQADGDGSSDDPVSPSTPPRDAGAAFGGKDGPDGQPDAERDAGSGPKEPDDREPDDGRDEPTPSDEGDGGRDPNRGTDPSWPALEVEQIGAPVSVVDGLKLAEGPLWHPCRKSLLFTDVDDSVIHELGSDGKISEFMRDTNYTNGIAFAPDGSLVLAQMGGGKGGRIVKRAPDGTLTVLADKDPTGKPLHTVDDVIVRSDGTIYFTDADFPNGPYDVNKLTVTLVQLPVYILRPGGMLIKGPMLSGPNGIELSPDEKTLYVASYFDDHVVKYAVAADGTLTRQGLLASRMSDTDSFCLDAAGNVYVGMASGVQVLRPDGTKVKVIPIRSADGTTNCTFGGEDGKTLFITAWTNVWKVEKMPIPGLDWTLHKEMCSP